MDRIATKFAPYIKELHEFFAIRGLHFGAPEDIGPLAEALGEPGSIHEEMTSMIRSIVYRERGVVPRTELLELIVVAVGGPRVDDAAQEVHGSVRQLHGFVGEVIQSMRRRSFVEEEEEESEPSAGVDGDSGLRGEGSGRGGGRFADVEEPVRVEMFEMAGAGVQSRVGRELVVTQAAPVVLPGRRGAWIAAGCVAAVLLASGLVWRHRSVTPANPVAQVAETQGLVAGSNSVGAVGPKPEQVAAGAGGTAVAKAGSAAKVLGASDAPVAGVGSRSGLAAGEGSTVRATKGGVGDSAMIPTPVQPAARPVAPRGAAAARAARSAARASGAGTVAAPAVVPSPGAFLVSSGVMANNLIAAPAPSGYPKMAGMAGVEGEVILQAVISSSGAVVATHVLDGHRLLRGAAAHAVRQWRYRPYTVDGKATDVATIVIVDFHLPH